jgi:hypothetical protein
VCQEREAVLDAEIICANPSNASTLLKGMIAGCARSKKRRREPAFKNVENNEAINRLLKKFYFSGCSKMPRRKAPEVLRVTSRRIRSDFLPRRRVG